MQTDPHPPSNNQPFQVSRIRKVTADLAVAEVDVGPVRVGSIWITGIEGGYPAVNWPRLGRGFPVITIVNDRLRESIEERLVAAVRGGEGHP